MNELVRHNHQNTLVCSMKTYLKPGEINDFIYSEKRTYIQHDGEGEKKPEQFKSNRKKNHLVSLPSPLSVVWKVDCIQMGLYFWKFTYKYVLSSEHKAQKIAGKGRGGKRQSFLWSPLASHDRRRNSSFSHSTNVALSSKKQDASRSNNLQFIEARLS